MCSPLIGRFFSHHYLLNLPLFCFYIGTMNSSKWSPDMTRVLVCSSDIPPNAAHWLVKSFLAIISKTPHQIAFILALWTHLRDPQTWLVNSNPQRQTHPQWGTPHSQCIQDILFNKVKKSISSFLPQQSCFVCSHCCSGQTVCLVSYSSAMYIKILGQMKCDRFPTDLKPTILKWYSI